MGGRFALDFTKELVQPTGSMNERQKSPKMIENHQKWEIQGIAEINQNLFKIQIAVK